MHLTKHHGLGNDFLICLGPPPPAAADKARALCHRRAGIGADGLIFAVDRPDGSIDMTLYNADGSRAELSGNGLRCLAQAVSDARGEPELDLVVHTDAGARRLTVVERAAPDTLIVRAEMGEVGLGVPAVDEGSVDELVGGRRWATGDIGNPHLVVLVESGSDFDIETLGPHLEACFAAGANVHAVERRGDGEIFVRTWERGAHLTEACGSGACVASAVLADWGLVGDDVTVEMPGGFARVELGTPVVLTGPATYVASIEVTDG